MLQNIAKPLRYIRKFITILAQKHFKLLKTPTWMLFHFTFSCINLYVMKLTVINTNVWKTSVKRTLKIYNKRQHFQNVIYIYYYVQKCFLSLHVRWNVVQTWYKRGTIVYNKFKIFINLHPINENFCVNNYFNNF